MEDYEMRALLGEFYDDTTEEQKDAIGEGCEILDRRFPADLYDLHTEALAAMLAVIYGDDTDTARVSAWKAAKMAEVEAHAAMTGAIIGAALTGDESEVAQAARLGVTRVTLRKALGR